MTVADLKVEWHQRVLYLLRIDKRCSEERFCHLEVSNTSETVFLITRPASKILGESVTAQLAEGCSKTATSEGPMSDTAFASSKRFLELI